MAVPDYQTFMLPVLRLVAAQPNAPVLTRDLFDAMAKEFNLNDDDLREMLPSGATTTLGSRVSWCCTYLKKAGLLAAPKRGYVQITERGLKVFASKPKVIDVAFLRQFAEFREFQGRRRSANEGDEPAPVSPSKTPHEILESGYQSLRAQLADELMERVKTAKPAFFERLVVELLVKMGYGGSLADAGRAVGRSGDGGIDGIIKEDRLGLDFIFIQAKRWTDKCVGRPDVQQFAGALAGQGASKGIFITTTAFSKEAVDYAAGLRHSKIVLIDGDELAELMIDHGIGCAAAAIYEVKRIDSDYFSESE